MLTIRLRTEDGWSEPVKNAGKDSCDKCGSRLYIGPTGPYCDAIHAGCKNHGKYTDEETLALNIVSGACPLCGEKIL